MSTNASGKLIFEPNLAPKPYIVRDSSRATPPEFGVKVAGMKVYIIRRMVPGTSIFATAGNVADFNEIAFAHKKAAGPEIHLG